MCGLNGGPFGGKTSMALRQPRDRRDDPPLTNRGLHLREVGQPADGEAYGGIGAELRGARERAGAELGEIARRLRIRVEHLQAVEEGRFDDLPGAVYAVGFLRSYAEHLGLDGEAVVTIFKDETQRYPGRTKLVFPLPGPEGRLPGGWLIVASLVLAALAYGGWYYISEQNRVAFELIPEVPERLAGLAVEETAGPPPAPVVETAPPIADELVAPALSAPDIEAADIATVTTEVVVSDREPAASAAPRSETPAAVQEPLDEPRSASRSPIAEAEAATAIDTTAAAAVAPEEPPAPAPTEDVASLADLASQPPPVLEAGRDDAGLATAAYVPLTYGAGNTDARVIVRARAESWVQVRGPEGELLLTRVMRPGDRFLAPNRDNLWLMTGNAGALELVVDGQVLPPLGQEGEVLRKLTLDADRLLAGSAVEP